MLSIMRDLLDIRGIYFFILLCTLSFLILFIKKNFIEYEITAFQILDERGELGAFKLISGLQYLSIPLIYVVKFTFIALFIWIGNFVFGYKVTFINCWHIVMVSEVLFIIPEMMKIMWFMLVETDPNLATVRAFYPLSLMHFFDHEQLAAKWHYPVKSLNLFEVVYWLMLVAGIYLKSHKNYYKSMIIGVFAYIIPYILWLGYYVLVYK